MATIGGTTGATAIRTHVGPPVSDPFGSAQPVESPQVRAIALGDHAPCPEPMAFLDGIQRFAVVARIGVTPVVAGYVAAAILARRERRLEVIDQAAEEFLVAPRSRLGADHWEVLANVGLPIVDCALPERAHPFVDERSAALVVERHRARLEGTLARRHCGCDDAEWLVVDGSIAGLGFAERDVRVLGLIKSHETQFLDGEDLQVALTMPVGHRSSVFQRIFDDDGAVYTWYLRLWAWEAESLLHGLVRVERPPVAAAVRTASDVSRWLMAERAPLSAPDNRWDRLCYPIRQVETYLQAQLGSWW